MQRGNKLTYCNCIVLCGRRAGGGEGTDDRNANAIAATRTECAIVLALHLPPSRYLVVMEYVNLNGDEIREGTISCN